MALIKCSECGNEVSDKAASCPKCGCPIIQVGVYRATTLNGEPVGDVTVGENNTESDNNKKNKEKREISPLSYVSLAFCIAGFFNGFISIIAIILANTDLNKAKKDNRKIWLSGTILAVAILTIMTHIVIGAVKMTSGSNHSSVNTKSESANYNYEIEVGGFKFTLPDKYHEDGENKYTSDRAAIAFETRAYYNDNNTFIDKKNDYMNEVDKNMYQVMMVNRMTTLSMANIRGETALKKEYRGIYNGQEYIVDYYIVNNTISGELMHIIYMGRADDANSYEEFENVIQNATLLNGNGSAASSTGTTTSTAASSTTTSTATSTTASAQTSSGVNPELKSFLDSYEKFVDEYVAYMKKYMNNPADAMSMMNDYNTIMNRYQEFESKLSKLDTSKMSTADYQYYLEVVQRCTNKMASIY